MTAPRILAALVGASTVLGACATSDDGSGGGPLAVTIAGDAEAIGGFAFPPATASDPAFVDGWDVRFERVIVTVDGVALADDPDTSPTDQSQTGPTRAVARGPWAVDLARPGKKSLALGTNALRPAGLDDDEGLDPQAQPLASFTRLEGDAALDPTTRYAFGFDFVAASASAKRTNLDAAGEADYADMIAKGVAVLYVGTATFKGTECHASDAASATPFDFASLPRSVRFRFGFRTPTQYRNCQNTSLRGKAFAGEEAPRGVQVTEHGTTVAQITVHVDHPFWDTVDHDGAQLFFDQIAAMANADGEVTLDDLARQDPTQLTDKAGHPLPWRSCLADHPVRAGTRKLDHGSVPVDRAASPDRALRNYADYMQYEQSTQGHLAADGLCAVTRLFPAPR